MAKLTKRMRTIREKVDVTKDYEINEAVALLKELATAKFVESVDVAVNLGIDARKSDQNVRGATVLPNGTGREVRVAVFTQGANADAAKEAGAELVGMEDLAEQVKKGEMNFDVVEQLQQNLEALIVALKKAKPSQAKGTYVKKVTISTTMGAGVAVDQNSLSTVVA